MSTGAGVGGLVLGGALIVGGLIWRRVAANATVTNQDGQSATVTGDAAKWIIIVLGVFIAIGGIFALLSNGKGG